VGTCCFQITQNLSELKGFTPASFEQHEQGLHFLSVVELPSKTHKLSIYVVVLSNIHALEGGSTNTKEWLKSGVDSLYRFTAKIISLSSETRE
jgi:hypothetical protein